MFHFGIGFPMPRAGSLSGKDRESTFVQASSLRESPIIARFFYKDTIIFDRGSIILIFSFEIFIRFSLLLQKYTG